MKAPALTLVTPANAPAIAASVASAPASAPKADGDSMWTWVGIIIVGALLFAYALPRPRL